MGIDPDRVFHTLSCTIVVMIVVSVQGLTVKVMSKMKQMMKMTL